MGTIQLIQDASIPRAAVRNGGTSRESNPARTVEAVAPEAPVIDPAEAGEVARQVQEALDRVAPAPHEIVFRRDETTNGFVIEVRNPDGSVVRQYPPEKLLNLRRKLDEMSGMVIDEMT